MIKPLSNIRIARVATVPFYILTQLENQLEAINEAGAEITVVSSKDDEYSQTLKRSGSYEFKPIYIAKEIKIRRDVIALFKLWRLFSNAHFDIVHSTTPKAGLLCGIAGRMARVPVRMHSFTGQPWVTLKGIKRSVVKFCDKLIVYLNTRCYVDSFSQRDFLVKSKVTPFHKIKILGSGSLAGIDINRFNQNNFSQDMKNEIRASLNISADTLVILFVGRITQDKGVFELLNAFKNLLMTKDNLVLVMVGPFENKIEQEIRNMARQWCGDKVIFTGFTQKPEQFMAITDIFCLPSYREGFGTVVIEAAAMGVPAIGTRIYGLTDAIIDGETGLLVELKNVVELTDTLRKLIDDPDLRKRLGKNAEKRAMQEFDSKKHSELLINEYQDLLKLKTRKNHDMAKELI
jgi:glycosyltransferase involved in cell wall biosynthesis